MLRNLVAGAITAACLLLVTGCWEPKQPGYLYLMLHPEYLQRVYNGCVEEVVSPRLPCEIIARAQADFTNLVLERTKDPEQFGSQILQAEENAVYFKQQLAAVVQAYHAIGTKHPGIEELKKIRQLVDKAEATYTIGAEKVKVLLTVIGETSSI